MPWAALGRPKVVQNLPRALAIVLPIAIWAGFLKHGARPPHSIASIDGPGWVLALMRGRGFVLIGIWFANGLLIAAHWFFLLGVARFTQTRLCHAGYLIHTAWTAMLLLPPDPLWPKLMPAVNSLLVTLLRVRASLLLRPHGRALSVGPVQLRCLWPVPSVTRGAAGCPVGLT